MVVILRKIKNAVIILIEDGNMNLEKLNIIKNNNGFIAALDQSGGSSSKTLELYGISKNSYKDDQEMFNLIHDMRTRIIKSNSFTNEKIIGVILFYNTMNSKIDDKYTSDYLWEEKQIISFLKIDNGLMELSDGVQLMKDIPNLEVVLDNAIIKGIFGTKMRSVIKEANEEGIKKLVKQQFDLAKVICSKGLVPIIEPEVSIGIEDKEKCEELLKKFIDIELKQLSDDMKIMFKFTIPSIDNFYEDYINNPKVIRVVALSGGYKRDEACIKLAKNNGMIASFSRALLEGLKVYDTNEEFDKKLLQSLNEIYEASIK